MSADPSSVAALLASIAHAGAALLQPGAAAAAEQSRRQLLVAAEQLLIALREPQENVYHIATQTAQNSAIRSAIAMGLFAAMPADGSAASIEQLRRTTDAGPALLGRILRACVSASMFRQVSPDHYAHSALSRVFAVEPNRDMFAQMYDFVGKAVYCMPRYLESRPSPFQDPGSYADGPFQYGHSTALGFFEFLREDAARMRLFNSGMRSLATVGSQEVSPYPFADQLGIVAADEVLVVDVGGGRGQALRSIRNAYPQLRGRMVLQDVPDVIQDAIASGLPDYIEPQPGSFFQAQPIKGARFYYFRRIFHDWGDADARRILLVTAASMDPQASRILIADTIVPELNAPRAIALQDINMMAFGGMERTELQWRQLLRSAGLEVVRVWPSHDDQAIHGVVEARLLPQPVRTASPQQFVAENIS